MKLSIMRKWVTAACCAVLLVGGCSGQAGSGNQSENQSKNLSKNFAEGTVDNLSISTKAELEYSSLITRLGTAKAGEEDTVELESTSATYESELASIVAIQQLDGTSVEWFGNAVTNEAIGYYLYLLPGFKAEVANDSGTMTLSVSGSRSQAILEALPPQADLQLAADELRGLMEQLDENMLQITDYQRFDFWSDAVIYRAYSGEDRITTIIKSVHDIPFRITITEPTDTDMLNLYMAMIHTIQTENLETLTQPDEEFVRQLVVQAYLQQMAVLAQFQNNQSADDGSSDSSSNSPANSSNSLNNNSNSSNNSSNSSAGEAIQADSEDNSNGDSGPSTTNDGANSERDVSDDTVGEDTADDGSAVQEEASSEETAGNSVEDVYSPDYSGYTIAGSSLTDILHSEEAIVTYFETVYTQDAAAQLLEILNFQETENGLLATWEEQESFLQWNQAKLSVISESENSMRYLLLVPSEEGVQVLREIELRKHSTGWRIHTPLDLVGNNLVN